MSTPEVTIPRASTPQPAPLSSPTHTAADGAPSETSQAATSVDPPTVDSAGDATEEKSKSPRDRDRDRRHGKLHRVKKQIARDDDESDAEEIRQLVQGGRERSGGQMRGFAPGPWAPWSAMFYPYPGNSDDQKSRSAIMNTPVATHTMTLVNTMVELEQTKTTLVYLVTTLMRLMSKHSIVEEGKDPEVDDVYEDVSAICQTQGQFEIDRLHTIAKRILSKELRSSFSKEVRIQSKTIIMAIEKYESVNTGKHVNTIISAVASCYTGKQHNA